MIKHLLAANMFGSVRPPLVGEIPPAPGPLEPLYWNTDYTFYGLVSPEDFISTPDFLATSNIGINYQSLARMDGGWFKFSKGDRVFYIAQYCIESSISYSALLARNVHDYSQSIVADRREFTIGLLTVDEYMGTIGNLVSGPKWGDFALNDVGTGSSSTVRNTWVIDPSQSTMAIHLGGNDGITRTQLTLTSASGNVGWRPVLEYIDPKQTALRPAKVGYTAPKIQPPLELSHEVRDLFYMPKVKGYGTNGALPVYDVKASISE